ncbi:MAG: hypothetical protein DYG89_15875 [Caldilinea sp. CFX5]|nr:hypothetical protein [Caldilinea sp. CFX5]
MTQHDFATHLYQPFQLQLNPLLTMSLALASVQDATQLRTEPKPQENTKAFSVIFQGPQHPVLPTRTYQLSHPRLGKLDLLLVPHERRQTGMCYKAIVPELSN